MHFKRSISIILVVAVTILNMSACGKSNSQDIVPQSSESQSSAVSSQTENTSQAKAVVRVGILKGPSSLGMLEILNRNEQKKSDNIYEFTMVGAPADIQAKAINGELDIAAVPTNVAATLFNKTNKDVSMIAISTLGVLYLLSKDEEVTSIKDLDGQTVYATGQGSSPEYVLNYILEKNDLGDKTEVLYKSEHSELAALMINGDAKVAMLPQPFVTTVMMKDSSIKIIADLNEEWKKNTDGAELAMGCVLVSNKYLATNASAVDKFLNEYKNSVEYVTANIDEAAELSEKFDIIPKNVAQQAIPKCGLAFLEGDDMKTSALSYLKVLFDANPQSVGGSLPSDEFFYKR